MKKIFMKNKVLLFAIVIAVLWLGLILFVYMRDTNITDNDIYELALKEARAYYTKDVFYINWITLEGGVYVPVTGDISPSPYLKVPDKDIITKNNKKLTLVDPAYITRLVHKMEFSKNYVRGHITSLTPIHPENKANDWERKALESFGNGNKEYCSLQEVDGKQTLRYMAPVFIEKPCLKCHIEQGYKIGDMKGGISVVLPYSHYASIAKSRKSKDFIFYSIIAFLGLVALHIMTSLSEKHKRELTIEKNKLLESDERFRIFSEIAEEGIIIHNQGVAVDINEAFEKITGYSKEEIIGEYVTKLIFHPDDFQIVKEKTETNCNEPYEVRLIKKNKTIIPVLLHGYSTVYEEKTLRVVSLRDISENKILENELAKSEEKWRTIIKTSPDGIAITTLDGRLDQASDRILQMYGFKTQDEVSGKYLFEFIEPEYFQKAKSTIIELLNGNHKGPSEYCAVKKDGTRFFVEINSEILRDKNGVPVNLIFIQRDVTKRKQTEALLENQNLRLAKIIEGAQAGTWEWNVQTGETIFNERWAQMLGFTLNELEPISIETWKKLIHPDDLEKTYRILEHHFNGKLSYYDFEFRMKHKNGNWVWVHDRGQVVTWTIDGKPLMMFGTHTDITKRKQVEEKLRESEEQIRLIIENSPVGIFFYDTEGKILICNIALSDIMGSPKELIIGLDLLKLPRTILAEGIQKTLNGEPAYFEEMYFAVTSGKNVFLRAILTPVFDNDNKVFGGIAIVEDFSERKKMEEKINTYNEKLENSNKELNESKELLEKSLFEKDQLVKELTSITEKLAKTNSEKDKFFSIIAHDLRSPFQGFIGLTEEMASNINDYTLNELSKFLREINSRAINLFKLLKNLLEWSKMQRGNFIFEPKEIDLFKLATQNVDLIKPIAEKKEILIINNVKEDQKIFADENMVNSVFSNLLTNAIKFTKKGGRVIVSSKQVKNEMLEISIQDNGIGMPDAILNNLFEIQKKIGRQGTDGEESVGLGLLLCKEFVEKHNGNIWAESTEGEGSKFIFTLPLASQENVLAP